MSEEKIKYLDMFAGIGGFRTGLSHAGDLFLPVGWCEIDRFCQKAYRALYGTGGEYFSDDATKIDTDEVPDIDLIRLLGIRSDGDTKRDRTVRQGDRQVPA